MIMAGNAADTDLVNTIQVSNAIDPANDKPFGQYRNDVELFCDLCAQFWKNGWMVGTGGGMSLQPRDSPYIFLTPSGIHKERLKVEDLCIYDTLEAQYVYVKKGRKPSASSILFIQLHVQHRAKCVIHTHSLHSNLCSRLTFGNGKDELVIIDQEYIKGLPDYETGIMLSNTDELRIPIIANKPTEDMLLGDLMKAVDDYPSAACVLVKNHGAYHFGSDLWKCKAQTECLEYLFELRWKLRYD